MDKFDKPAEVSGVDMAFGGDMKKLLPPYEDIPEEFHSMHNKWGKIAARWFFEGLPKGTKFLPKEGIEPGAAVPHLKAILVSFEPKHEHKQAGVAWLMSRWFEDIEIPEQEDAAVTG
jgi:hypothetical protein